MKRTLIIVMALSLGIGMCFAEEGAGASTDADMEKTLESLRGLEGISGGNSRDMDQVLNMVQTPEMSNLVNRLNQQLAAESGDGTIDPASVEAFVRQNLTKEDVEKVMGRKISDDDFNRVKTTPINPDEVKRMRERLGGDPYIVQ